MNLYLKYLLAFIIGVGVGTLLLILLPYISLSVSNPIFPVVGIQKPRVVAFLPYFLSFRANNNYNPYITTLDYFSLTIGSDGHVVKLSTPQQEDPGWYDLQSKSIQQKLQRARNNHIDLSLTVSQSDEASISSLLADPKRNAKTFLGDIIPVLKKYQFTDLNIDIESFQKPDTKKIQAFTTFIQMIQNELKKDNIATLTVDIPPIAFIKTNIVGPVEIGRIADYMLVMAYDYNTVISPNTGPVAPLNGIGEEREYDVATAISIAKKEINPQKIIFGTPLYGYEWDSLSSTPGAATIPNTGQTASSRRISGIFTASCSTCSVTQDILATEPDFVFQDTKGDPYYHQAFLFDENSMSERILFAKKNHLGGVALWALGYEGNTLLKPLAPYKSSFHFQYLL